MTRPLALALLIAAAGGCAAPAAEGAPAASVQSRSEIEALRARFVDAYARADAEAVAAFYAPHATYIGTGGDVVTGRDRLLVGLRREVPVFRDFRVEPAEFEADGRLAFERGIYQATIRIPGRDPEPVSGPYLIVYERGRDGRWLVRQHMSGRHRR